MLVHGDDRAEEGHPDEEVARGLLGDRDAGVEAVAQHDVAEYQHHHQREHQPDDGFQAARQPERSAVEAGACVHRGRDSQTIPPLGCTICPCTQDALSEARKATTSAISRGWPMRLNGLSAAMRAFASSVLPAWNRSVSTGPGATALTRTLRGASKAAVESLVRS